MADQDDVITQPAGVGGCDGTDYARVCHWHRWVSAWATREADLPTCTLCEAEAEALAGKRRYRTMALDIIE